MGRQPALPSMAEGQPQHLDPSGPSQLFRQEDAQQHQQQLQQEGKQKAQERVRRNFSGSVRISEPGIDRDSVPSRPSQHGVDAGSRPARGKLEGRPSLLQRASGLWPGPPRSVLDDELQQEALVGLKS